jgi:mRNA-degrading endonuclease RelE of RelBE toxin-antitoxin system
MVDVAFTEDFKNIFFNIKDNLLKEKILKQIEKIKVNPEVGKPMRYERKGTRELYIKPFRLSYEYFKDGNKVYILDLYHKKKQ